MEATAKVKITPRMMAEAFWNMSADEQSDFFAELHDAIIEGNQPNPGAYGLGEAQWCAMGKEINKDSRSKEMACAMLAWVFNHSTDFLDRRLP